MQVPRSENNEAHRHQTQIDTEGQQRGSDRVLHHTVKEFETSTPDLS